MTLHTSQVIPALGMFISVVLWDGETVFDKWKKAFIVFLFGFLGSLPNCDAATNQSTTYSTLSTGTVDELQMPPGSLGRFIQHHLNQPKNNPTQPLVTQMQPPMLPPPPHPHFKSVHVHTSLPVTDYPLLISDSEASITHSQTSVVSSETLGTTVQYLLTKRQSHLTLSSSRRLQLQHDVSDKLLMESDSQGSNIHTMPLASEITKSFTEVLISQPPSVPSVGERLAFLKSDSYLGVPTQNLVTKTKKSHSVSDTQSSSFSPKLHQTKSRTTKSQFYQVYHEPMSIPTDQANLRDPAQPIHWTTQWQASPTPSQMPQSDTDQSFTPSPFQKFHLEQATIKYYLPYTQSPPLSVTLPEQSHFQPFPTMPEPSLTVSPLPPMEPQLSPTQHPLLSSQTFIPQTETFPLDHSSPLLIQPSFSTIYPPDQTLKPSTVEPEIPGVHQVNMSDQVQLNISKPGDPVQSAKSANDTELTEWLKRNTSQSPMTSNDPR